MTRLRFSLLTIALISVALATASSAAAVAPNDLDTSYGTAGVSPFKTNPDPSSALPTALLPDGKLLVGYTPNGAKSPNLVRLNTDGSLDATFGIGGSVTIPVTGSETFYIGNLLLEGDGTILVLGSLVQPPAPYGPAIYAYAANGATKTGFGTNGRKALPTVGTSTNYLRGSALLPNGNVALAAQVEVGGKHGIALNVLTASGAVANSGSYGEPGVDVDPYALTVTASGRILVAASVGSGSTIYKVYAFTSTAGADNSWGLAGSQSFGIASTNSSFYGFLPLGDRIAAHGSSASGAAVTVYEADGSLSPSAGSNGTNRFTPFNSANSSIYTGTVTPRGQLLLAGQYSVGTGYQLFLARMNPNGSLDQSFLGGGVGTVPGTTGNIYDLNVQADGKYLVTSVSLPDRILTVRRIWGDATPAAPVAATAGFSKSIKSKMKAKKLKTIKGTASGTGVTKVELAIQKIDSKLLKKKKRCSYVKSTKTTIKKVKAVKGKCKPSVWIKASGTASWSVKLKKALKPGKYVFSVRATGAAGVGAVKTKKVTLTTK
jgi:uncharacterized delta-60 repeat protein